MAATLTAIGMPQTKKPASPITDQDEWRPFAVPNAARTACEVAPLSPASRSNRVPTFTLAAKPLAWLKLMMINGRTVVNRVTDNTTDWSPLSTSLKRWPMATKKAT